MAGEAILVVDDQPHNLKLARLLLTLAGYSTATATDAETALQLLDTFRPRLILMDLQLPGIDGIELTRRLKADDRYRDIVIVAVTAYAMKGDREKALAAGCDGYISKPLDTQAFARIIAEHLARGVRGGS